MPFECGTTLRRLDSTLFAQLWLRPWAVSPDTHGRGVRVRERPPIFVSRAYLPPRAFAHHGGVGTPSPGGVAPSLMILAGRLGFRKRDRDLFDLAPKEGSE